MKPSARIKHPRKLKFPVVLDEEEKMLFICYPKCSTCKRAQDWLNAHSVEYTSRHIAEDNPSYEELKEWHGKSARES